MLKLLRDMDAGTTVLYTSSHTPHALRYRRLRRKAEFCLNETVLQAAARTSCPRSQARHLHWVWSEPPAGPAAARSQARPLPGAALAGVTRAIPWSPLPAAHSSSSSSSSSPSDRDVQGRICR